MSAIVFVGGPSDGVLWACAEECRSISIAGPTRAAIFGASLEDLERPLFRRGYYVAEVAPDGRPVCDVEPDGVAVRRFLWEGWDG